MGEDSPERRFGFAADSAWGLPSVGFGAYLFIADSLNAPMILLSDSEVTYISRFVFVVLLAGAAWLVLRRDWEHSWSVLVVAVSAVCVSLYYGATLYAPSILQQPILGVVVETASELSRAALAFFWLVALLPLGSRRVVYVLTLSICVFALLCLISFLFKDDVARVALVLLPLLSGACLQLFYRTRSRSFEPEPPTRDEIYLQSQKYLSARDNQLVYGLGIFMPLMCGAVVFALIHQAWPSFSTESHALFSAQTGLLIGAVVMAVLQLVLVNFFWTSTNLMFASVVVPLFLMDMILISVSEPSWVTVYYALMLLVEKSLLVLAVYASYVFKLGKSWMTPWYIAFLGFQVGGLIGASIQRFLAPENPLFILVGIVTFYVASVCIASLYFGVRVTQAYEGYAAGGLRRKSHYMAAIESLAKEFGLTSRECEMLAELGRGRNAAYIAERLTLSSQTVKTHQKNIYAKMDLHSQQDLIMLIDRAIEDGQTE